MQNNIQLHIKNRLNFLLQTPEERKNRIKNLSEENNKKLLSLKDIHKGKRCFIIGTSPSIKEFDLVKLNNEYTFSVNRGYKLSELGLNHTTYHVMSDTKVFSQDNIFEEIPLNYSDKFLIYGGIDFPGDNVIFFDYLREMNREEIKFQPDILKPLGNCDTVIYYTIQFAYYMGFKNIYLLGVDLDFAKLSKHCYEESEGEKQRQLEHSIKMAQFMLKGIDVAAKFLKKNNVNFLNASTKGIVDCIERVKYEELF